MRKSKAVPKKKPINLKMSGHGGRCKLSPELVPSKT